MNKKMVNECEEPSCICKCHEGSDYRRRRI